MPELGPTHTVVFDLDDTLYPEADFVRSGFRAVDAWLRASRGIEGFLVRATALFDAGQRKQIFDAVLRQLERPEDPALVAGMLAVYRDHIPAIALPAGTEAVLAWAAGRFNLAVVTDGYAAVQRNKLVALRLDRWLTYWVVTDELGRERWKPHPAGFERVMERFPGPRDGYVYVGDNPVKDFIAPKALGWGTVRLRRAGTEHGAAEGAPEAAAATTIPELSALRQLLVPANRSP